MWTHARLIAVLIAGASLLLLTGTQAQTPVPPVPRVAEILSANQLDDLVAPVALYPDPLLTQVLVASTYPLELVEAGQWLQRNPTLTGTALTTAAQQQNWDPSVQALVVFPDLIKRLTDDIAWTTNLGNAFLSQQPDVMDAVQRVRIAAQQASQLSSNAQQTVTTTADAGRSYISIVPAEPEVIFVPVYDPVWIWGPCIYYPYPRWHYPPRPFGPVVIIWGPPIIISSFLPGPWIGWAAWGWYPIWMTHTVFVNTAFVTRYHFNSLGYPVSGPIVWSHDPFHRQGVPYPSRNLTEQYRAGVRENLRPPVSREPIPVRPPMDARPVPLPSRPLPAPAPAPSAPRPAPVPAPPRQDHVGNRTIPSSPPARNPGAFGGIENGHAAQQHIDRGHSSMGAAKPAPRTR
jgi:hypothetical protein